MNKRRGEYDLAYGCFLICGLAALLASLMEAVPKDAGTAALLGFFVAIPLVLVSFGALVVGIVQCIRLPNRRRLVILCGMSVLFVVALVTGHGSTAFYYVISITYGLAVAWISGAWFLILRRREVGMP
jgi:hypothetical protein